MDEFGLKKMKEQLASDLNKLENQRRTGMITEHNYREKQQRIESLIDELERT